MSKGLESLARIKKLLEDKYGLLIYVDELDTIETELKRLEVFDREHQDTIKAVCEMEEVLRIIKEKRVDTARLRYVLEHETPKCFESKLDWYNFPFDCCKPATLTQAEFDLLKEWLK